MWPGYKLYSAIKLIIEGDSLTARAKIYFWRAERSVEASNHYNGLAYERVWTLTAAVGFDPEIDLEGLERPETAVLVTDFKDEGHEFQRTRQYFLSDTEALYAQDERPLAWHEMPALRQIRPYTDNLRTGTMLLARAHAINMPRKKGQAKDCKREKPEHEYWIKCR